MLTSQSGAANALGSVSRLYRAGEVLTDAEPWLGDLCRVFLAAGWAREVKADAPPEDKAIHSAPENKSAMRFRRRRKGDTR